ncbi:hypothetical protein BFJ63_vAg13510 [Fusarium oxysporum f. sp. narcissi]|uniref:Uncharacterized protein n=1 Tax=Fusarium oxysporum f. sp. narcissi TaxID=451672 RepID=A0A4Q2VGH8_FUSOX|nr:hypothetical protein BFJ63_vAg13510 [Fusarium oxysporum f. sp. narcissi]
MEMKNTPSGAMTITVEQAHQKIMAAPEKMSLPLAQGACAQKAASVCGANVLEPTSAQVDALRGFAQRHGRYWKSKLKALWIDGKEERHPDAYLLRQTHSLEQPGAVGRIRAKWRGAEPTSMIVIEYCGEGDPAFGGTADDRALGPDGYILRHEQRLLKIEPVEFATLEEAHEASKLVKNRRPRSMLGVAPTWR